MLLDGIKARCKEKNITIAELERMAGIGNGVVGRWDKMNPRLDSLCAVASALDVTVDELLKDNSNGNQKQE